jgi:glycine cleavage system H protein
VAFNQGVVDDPSLVNADPMGKGWLFKMKIADRSQVEALMDEQPIARWSIAPRPHDEPDR